jgi:hypothetical protein
MKPDPPRIDPSREQFLTLKSAADALGLPYFKLQRAARQGLLPTYGILNGRRYVKLSDILARMSHQNS